MRFLLVILLCFLTFFGMVACNDVDMEHNIEVDQNSMSSSTVFTDYDSIISVYRKIAELCVDYDDEKMADDTYEKQFGIFTNKDREWFNMLVSSTYLFYPGRGEDDSSSPHHKFSLGYAQQDLNKDGINELILLRDDLTVIAIFSMSNDTVVLLDNFIPRYSCKIDSEGLLHTNGNDGAGYFCTRIYSIADGGSKLNLVFEFGSDGFTWVGDSTVNNYYKIENDKKTDITEDEFIILDTIESNAEKANIPFTPLFELSDPEIAAQTYEAVLQNKTKVYDVQTQSYKFLKDCQAPYTGKYLSVISRDLKYAYVDMDGDGLDELIIDCGDTLVLHYSEGSVYCYSFIFQNMYYINTDGSYSWNRTSGTDIEYGNDKLIAFDREKVTTENVWKIVNDGAPNAEYYIGGKQVKHEEILKYFENNKKTKVEFSPLDLSFQNNISRSEALKIAKNYWSYWSTQDGFIVEHGVNDTAPSSVYVIVIKQLVMNEHYSTVDEIWIDINTGETIIPNSSIGGK